MKIMLWFLSALLLPACDPCINMDCRTFDYRWLRFVSRADNSDLLVSRQYAIDSLRITPLLVNPAPTGLVEYSKVMSYHDYNYDIVLQVDSNVLGFAIQLDSLAPDTLLFGLQNIPASACCPASAIINQTVLNGDTLAKDSMLYTIWIAK